eukprot:jgi/Psemu1/221450/e_gw1.1124.10.1
MPTAAAAATTAVVLEAAAAAAAAAASDSITPVPISFVGMNYNTRKGPDWAADAERCKTRSEIVRDLTLLARVTSRVRILSLADCHQAGRVLSVLRTEAATQNLSVWLGVWVGSDPGAVEHELQTLEGLLKELTTQGSDSDSDSDSNNPDGFLSQNRLLGVTVGSEAIYRDDVTIDEAIGYLDKVRSLLNEYNVDVPAAIVDIAPIYSNSQALRLASDVIATNTFPFWEGIPVELAVDELETDLGWLLGLPESRGKPFVLGEHGWPSDGYIEGTGDASPEHQKRYLADSFCYLREKGWEYYLFTGIDNDWRQIQDPNNSIEGNWGILD